jgi:hypothetical protein
MVVLFPVPGLLANWIQKVQKETMKRVGLPYQRIRHQRLTSKQTDARVQAASESEVVPTSKV